MDDTELLARLRALDEAAWAQVFEEYGRPLYWYIRKRWVNSLDAAEDLRQETFLAAIRSIDRFSGQKPLFGWLCGIAHHKAVDYIKQRGRQTLLHDAYCQIPNMDNATLPQDILERSEVHADTIKALWSMEPDYRKALQLRYVEGKSVEEAATVLNRSYKSMESLLSRARRALRKLLSDEGGLDHDRN